MATYYVAANADDAMLNSASGWTDATYSYVGHSGAPPVPSYATLLRIALSIPAGSTIDSAVLAFLSLGGAGTVSVPIQAVNAKSCGAFPIATPVSLMVPSVTWNQAALGAGQTYTSPDISAVVQGWLDGFTHDDGDYLGLDVNGIGATGQNMLAVSTKNGSNPPAVTITWTPPAAGSITPVHLFQTVQGGL